jgi:hypothetical protein
MFDLDCVRPGAKAGQVILAVDLSIAGMNPDESMAVLKELGYEPENKLISYTNGVRVFAFLKNEQHPKGVKHDYLMAEWCYLRGVFAPESVHLWRGYSSLQEAKAS